MASSELFGVTALDPVTAPEAPRRRDGPGVHTRPDRQRWALRATLDQERLLLDVTPEPTGRRVDVDTIEAAIVHHGLGGVTRDRTEPFSSWRLPHLWYMLDMHLVAGANVDLSV